MCSFFDDAVFTNCGLKYRNLRLVLVGFGSLTYCKVVVFQTFFMEAQKFQRAYRRFPSFSSSLPNRNIKVAVSSWPQHFTTWMKYYCQVPLFQSGSKCPHVQSDAILDIYSDHLRNCERGIHKMRRHDGQVRFLEADLIKAARH